MTEHLITSFVVETNDKPETIHVSDGAYALLLKHGWVPPMEVPPLLPSSGGLLERVRAVVHWQPVPASVAGPAFSKHGAVAA